MMIPIGRTRAAGRRRGCACAPRCATAEARDQPLSRAHTTHARVRIHGERSHFERQAPRSAGPERALALPRRWRTSPIRDETRAGQATSGIRRRRSRAGSTRLARDGRGHDPIQAAQRGSLDRAEPAGGQRDHGDGISRLAHEGSCPIGSRRCGCGCPSGRRGSVASSAAREARRAFEGSPESMVPSQPNPARAGLRSMPRSRRLRGGLMRSLEEGGDSWRASLRVAGSPAARCGWPGRSLGSSAPRSSGEIRSGAAHPDHRASLIVPHPQSSRPIAGIDAECRRLSMTGDRTRGHSIPRYGFSGPQRCGFGQLIVVGPLGPRPSA